MPGVPIVEKNGGPTTYTPANNEAIRGGLLVEARAAGRIGAAAAGSFVVLGVALNDAQAPEQLVTGPTVDAQGRNVLNAAVFPTTVAVAHSGDVVPVTYAANAAFGQKLIAAANGTVTPAGATPDARTIVGTCREPLGVVVGTNAVGLIQTA